MIRGEVVRSWKFAFRVAAKNHGQASKASVSSTSNMMQAHKHLFVEQQVQCIERLFDAARICHFSILCFASFQKQQALSDLQFAAALLHLERHVVVNANQHALAIDINLFASRDS